MKKSILLIMFAIAVNFVFAQTHIVTYAGGTGTETFYDVMQITDGTFLVCGSATDLNWIGGSVTKMQLANTSCKINNGCACKKKQT